MIRRDDKVERKNAASPDRGCNVVGAENIVESVLAAAVGSYFIFDSVMVGCRVNKAELGDNSIHARGRVSKVFIQVAHDYEFVASCLQGSQEVVEVFAEGLSWIGIFLACLSEKMPLLRIRRFGTGRADGLIAYLINRDECDASPILAVESNPTPSS